jgi:hypothetical protein
MARIRLQLITLKITSMNINLGSIQLPLNAATKTFAILAKRGAGKSYTGAVLAEEFHKNNIPFVVFDPIDVWWGLRLDKNGKDKGLPVVVFGLEHADIPLTRDMGKDIAHAIVQENVSCVISTFGMPKVAQRHLIAEFAEELLNINNIPRHIFIEEAHEFVPQRVFGALGKTFHAVSNLIVMGRNRGIGVTLINQRAATINKDVLTQLDTLLAFRNVSPQDRKALKEWVEYHAAEGDFDKFMQSLPSLPTGEGWIWSPEFLGIFARIKIRERETFHPDREKIGDKFTMPQLDQVDIQNFIDRFSQKEKVPAKSIETIAPPAEDDSKVLSHPQVIAMRNDYESKLMQKDIEISHLQAKLTSIRAVVGEAPDTAALHSPSLVSNRSADLWLKKFGNSGAGKILRLLVDHPGRKFTRQQLALAVGYSVNAGYFRTCLSQLRTARVMVEQDGQIMINPDL